MREQTTTTEVKEKDNMAFSLSPHVDISVHGDCSYLHFILHLTHFFSCGSHLELLTTP